MIECLFIIKEISYFKLWHFHRSTILAFPYNVRFSKDDPREIDLQYLMDHCQVIMCYQRMFVGTDSGRFQSMRTTPFLCLVRVSNAKQLSRKVGKKVLTNEIIYYHSKSFNNISACLRPLNLICTLTLEGHCHITTEKVTSNQFFSTLKYLRHLNAISNPKLGQYLHTELSTAVNLKKNC